MRRPGADGVEDLWDAANAVGLTVESAPADAGVDLILGSPLGGRTRVQVKRSALVSADSIERLISSSNADPVRHGDIMVIVADRITEQARRLLNEAGQSWLDLRGHLHLVGEGLFVDATVPRLRQAPGRATTLAGGAAQEVAAFLLLNPARPAPVREIARALRRSASTVSQAISGMREASLVDEARRPVIPDLFWELAERWKPVSSDVRRAPLAEGTGPIEGALRLGLHDVGATTGWALTDTLAAAAYAAPIGARSDHPPDFYVPDETVLRRAMQLLDPAPSHEMRAATIRVAPFPLVCADRVAWTGEWPLARPLFVALDLSRDPGRGREVLDGWTPPAQAGHRVW